jgi:hypothetical protein
MLIRLDAQQAPTVLGAMRRVATARGAEPLTAADRVALDAFDRFMLRGGGLDADSLPDPPPATLAALVRDAGDRTHVVQFLVVMALVDGAVDEGRIAVVAEYATALDSNEEGVRQLAALGRGNLAWVRADMQRQNLLSITGRERDVPIEEWIPPYRGNGAAPRARGALPHARGIAGGRARTHVLRVLPRERFRLSRRTGRRQRVASPRRTTPRTSCPATTPPHRASCSCPRSPPACIRARRSPVTSCR